MNKKRYCYFTDMVFGGNTTQVKQRERESQLKQIQNAELKRFSMQINDMLCLNVAKHLYPEYFTDTFFLNDGRIGKKSFKLEPLVVRDLQYKQPGKADRRFTINFHYKSKFHYASDLQIWENCNSNAKDLVVTLPKEIGLVCRNDLTIPDATVVLNMRDQFKANVLLLSRYTWLQDKMNNAGTGKTPKRIFESCKSFFRDNGVTLILTNELSKQ
jgi:hypothetical protein